MITFFRSAAFALTLIILGVGASDAMAQSSRKGPNGLKKGETSQVNLDRKMLLEKQKAVASAKTSGGMTSSPVHAMPENKYDTGKGGFKVTKYETKSKGKKAKPKKSKRLIDQDNPDGRIYQQTLAKRERKFLIF